MDNKEIKKRSQIVFSLWLLMVIIVAVGTFLFCSRFRKMSTPSLGTAIDNTSSTVSGVLQEFSGDGFSFSVPESWYVEKNGKNSVAAYPDYSPSAPSSTGSGETCKIEMSAFPPVADADIADWISNRLGADPSVAVSEESSDDISIGGGSGVQWTGTIDGVLTTLVYAFSDSHAFEIAPSVVNQTSADAGNAECADALGTFLSNLTLE